MESALKISTDLSLPKSAVTSTLLVYGGKGMGKSNFGAVLLEEMSSAGLRWAALDPMGVLWGLRYAADGRSPGVPCLILGGSRGDIPLEPTGGAVVADLVVDNDVNVIVDISRKPSGEMWGVGERIRFVTDYGRRLFARQGSLVQNRRREPLFQLIDEAARFMPQVIRAGEPQLAQCLSVWATIVEEGRNIGLGVGILTQRSARISKDVAELADMMLAFRTVGPNSIGAVVDWLGEHIPRERVKSMVETIRSLPVGSALAVSPGWLKHEDVVRIRPRRTFDSSATPKPGEEQRRVSGQGAKPDLEKYQVLMKETIERAEQDDPKALRKKIVELEKTINEKHNSSTDRETEPLRLRVSELESYSQSLASAVDGYKKRFEALSRCVPAIKEVAAWIEDKPEEVLRPVAAKPQPSIPHKAVISAPTRIEAKTNKTSNSHVDLTGPERRILNAIAWFESLGIDQPEQPAVAFLAGYSYGGGYNNPRGHLNVLGLLSYATGNRISLTDKGRDVAEYPESPASAEELHSSVMNRLPGPEQRILKPLLESYPDPISNEELAKAAGYTVGSGGYNNPRGRLRTLGLVEYPLPNMVRARDLLFPN